MKKKIKSALLSAICTAVLFAGGCQPNIPPEQSIRREIFAMDTVMNIEAYGGGCNRAEPLIENEIKRLEGLFSVTDSSSEISRINGSSGKAVSVSDDTVTLIKEALAVCSDTNGALDPTVYPIVRDWGFTTGKYQIPSGARLSELTEKVDYRRIVIDESNKTVTLPDRVEIDLGAVAKGYTGDRICDILREYKVDSALLNLGGNVQTIGKNTSGSPWRVGIRNPASPEDIICTVKVEDKAVITSGDYERSFEGEDGKRYWHIIDPSTGYPADKGLSSVTVVGKRGVECDALSTALFVMGREGAADYCRQHPELEVILIDRDNRLWITSGLREQCDIPEGQHFEIID